MWALIQNNPLMVALIASVVVVAVLLHVGVYLFFRRVMRSGADSDSDSRPEERPGS